MTFLYLTALGFLGFFFIILVAATVNGAIHLIKEIIHDDSSQSD